MDLLPTEILEKIFCELDGVSFGKILCVCTLWKDIYHQIALKHWEVLCKREIPSYAFHEIKSKIHTTKSSLYENDKTWQNIYIDWHIWKNFPNMVNSKESITMIISATLRDQISCMKVSGSVIITGHRTGEIKLWDRQTKLLYSLPLCETPILDMALFDNTCPNSRKLPGMLHDTIITTAADRELASVRTLHSGIYTGYGKKLSTKPTIPNMLRSNGGDIGAVMYSLTEQGATISVFRVFDRPGQNLPQIVQLYHYVLDLLYYGCCINVSLENQLTILTKFQIPCMFKLDTGELISSFELNDPIELSTQPFLSVLLRSNIFIQVIEREAECVNVNYAVPWPLVLSIQVDKSLKEYRATCLGSLPSAFLLHSTLFFIGTRTGDVFAYCVMDDTDLLSLSLEDFAWKHSGSGFPVKHMDVWHRGKDRGLVISSPRTMCFIPLF